MPAIDAIVPHNLHAVFDHGQAVWNFREVALAKFFPRNTSVDAALEPEGAVIRGDDLQCPVSERLPQYLLVMDGADWRRTDKLSAFIAGLGEIVGGQEQILYTGFTLDWQSALPTKTKLLNRFLAGHMYDVERATRYPCQCYSASRGLALNG